MSTILKRSFAFLITALSLPCSYAIDRENTAPVTGFARVFLTNKAIPDATITIIETGQQIKTNEEGFFGPIAYPVGKPLTLLFSKPGYTTTQSGTVIIPKQGLTGPYNNITFQIPSDWAYFLLKTAIGVKENPDSCHVATTITAYHKTLDDIPQGEADATVTLTPNVIEQPFYFDIFNSGPFKGITYPFATGLNKTSMDGGVAFFNLPPRTKPYQLSAIKAGVTFSKVQFMCRKGVFINISPPRGPMAQRIQPND